MAYDIPRKLLGLVGPTVCTYDAPAVVLVLPVGVLHVTAGRSIRRDVSKV